MQKKQGGPPKKQLMLPGLRDNPYIIPDTNRIYSNAHKHKRNPEFIDDAVRTAENVVNRISRLIDHLRRDPPPITVSRGKRRMALSYYYKPAGLST